MEGHSHWPAFEISTVLLTRQVEVSEQFYESPRSIFRHSEKRVSGVQNLRKNTLTVLGFNRGLGMNDVIESQRRQLEHPHSINKPTPDTTMHVYNSHEPAMNGGSFTHNNTVAPNEKSVFSLLSLKGKTAIISGAGAGIGLRVAQAFAEAGANVAIWYHSNKDAMIRAQEIETTYAVKCEWALLCRPSSPY